LLDFNSGPFAGETLFDVEFGGIGKEHPMAGRGRNRLAVGQGRDDLPRPGPRASASDNVG
jgi:hypothetical protein